MKKPLVSVLMLTYNQEQYIKEALDSVILQQTNFAFEIVIGDDASKDSTRKILLEYEKKYPEVIRLLLHRQNLKPVHNLIRVYKKCQGKYVALLEGDDFWTSPHKLQKQVDFLESHPKYAVCYHFAKMCDTTGKELLLLPIEKYRKLTATLKDLAENDSFMPTCSTMFRNKLFPEFPKWFTELTYIADFPLNILNAEHGDIGLLDQTMSVYRAQSSLQAFSSQSVITVHLEKIKVFNAVNRHLNFVYTDSISDRLGGYYFLLAKACLANDKVALSKKIYKLYSNRKYKVQYISKIDRIILRLRLLLA